MSDDDLRRWMADAKARIAEYDERARAEGKIFIDEEKDRAIIDGWYVQAKACRTVKDAVAFALSLDQYRHDYGSCCHAIAASAVAMANAVSAPLGITGFQAGAVFWEFYRHWMNEPETPKRMLDYGNMLYPQYEHSFRNINQNTMGWLQEKAAEQLAGMQPDDWRYEHLASIVAGNAPFGYGVER